MYEEEEEEEEEYYEEVGDDDGNIYLSTETISDVVDEDWEEEEDSIVYPLVDDPDDHNYQKQKELVEAAMREPRIELSPLEEFDFVTNNITDEQAQQLDNSDFMKEVENRAENLMLTEQDLADANIDFTDLGKAVASVSDIMEDDPYE